MTGDAARLNGSAVLSGTATSCEREQRIHAYNSTYAPSYTAHSPSCCRSTNATIHNADRLSSQARPALDIIRLPRLADVN